MTLPVLMATPPTVTLSALNAASSISGSALTAPVNSSTGVLTGPYVYAGAHVAQSGATFPRNAMVTATGSITGLNELQPYRGRFKTNADQFEIKTRGSGAKYRIRVDGQLAAAGPSAALPTDGGVYLILVAFGSAATREITIEATGGFDFAGINVAAGYSVTAPAAIANPVRAILIGDSFAEGTGADASFLSFVQTMGDTLGWSDVWASGSGGTGYLATITGRVKFGDRLTNDVLQWSPDVVIFAGGLNDSASTQMALAAECAADYAAVRAALPNALLIVVGPIYPHSPVTQFITDFTSTMRTAATNAGAIFIDAATDPWFTGTGNTAHPSATGNSSTLISPDNTHPVQGGHDYLGGKIATAIQAAAFPAIAATVTPDRASANTGDVITFTVAVTNSGSANATGVSATLDVSALLGTLGTVSDSGSGSSTISWSGLSLAIGATKNLTVAVTLGSPANGSTLIATGTATTTNKFPGAAAATASGNVHVVLRRVFAPVVRSAASRSAAGARSAAGTRVSV